MSYQLTQTVRKLLADEKGTIYKPHGDRLQIALAFPNSYRLGMSNLGYQNHTLSVDNLDLPIVAKDASLLVGRDGTKNYITTNSVDVGPGESRDVIFTAPSTSGTYLLYDRKYSYLNNGGGAGYGGMRTEIRVGTPGQYPTQTVVNG